MKSFQLVKTKIKVPYWCYSFKIASVRLVYFNIQLNFHLLTSSKVKAACLPQIKKAGGKKAGGWNQTQDLRVDTWCHLVNGRLQMTY